MNIKGVLLNKKSKDMEILESKIKENGNAKIYWVFIKN